jgi:hypothetical protein
MSLLTSMDEKLNQLLEANPKGKKTSRNRLLPSAPDPDFEHLKNIAVGNSPPYKLVSWFRPSDTYCVLSVSEKFTPYCGPSGYVPYLFYGGIGENLKKRQRPSTLYAFKPLSWFPDLYEWRNESNSPKDVLHPPSDWAFRGIEYIKDNPRYLCSGAPVGKRGGALLEKRLCDIEIPPVEPGDEPYNIYTWIKFARNTIEGFEKMRLKDMLEFMWNERIYYHPSGGPMTPLNPRHLCRLALYALKHEKLLYGMHDHLTLKSLWKEGI